MNVSMATKNTATYFNILAPGETEVAFFNGSVSENQYEGVLPATGDYKIRVYMMRSAARRNEKANYRLEMIVSGAADGGRGESRRAGARHRLPRDGEDPLRRRTGQADEPMRCRSEAHGGRRHGARHHAGRRQSGDHLPGRQGAPAPTPAPRSRSSAVATGPSSGSALSRSTRFPDAFVFGG